MYTLRRKTSREEGKREQRGVNVISGLIKNASGNKLFQSSDVQASQLESGRTSQVTEPISLKSHSHNLGCIRCAGRG